MRPRFAILLTLILIRVFFTPIWYSYNVTHLKNPAAQFEQVRLHKRRSGFTDDVGQCEGMISESVPKLQRIVFNLLRIIKRYLATFRVVTISSFHHYTSYLSPLFLRHCVLRI